MNPHDVADRIDRTARKRWTTLDLHHAGLTQLPDSIGQLTSLQRLYLFDNQLTALPDSVGQLPGLQALYLYHNQLASFPDSIAQLTNLVELDLSGNQLTSLPDSIGQLVRLQTLRLSDNRLASLPDPIGQLASLRTLHLSGNRLTSLPDSIGQLARLQTLNLSNNQRITLPDSIRLLASLLTLDLSSNHLVTLPDSIRLLTRLQKLVLSDNPLYPALQSASDVGLDALRAYMRSLAEAEPLYEARLLLVGEGGVGKTTLLKALTGQEPRRGEPTTHGVDIEVQALRLPHPELSGIDIQVNTWDFGGQDVYKPTHQFFFSSRSVYLVVWEPRRGVQQCQVEDWLKLIRLRVGSDARVIVVSTHARTGQRIARIDQPVLQRDYPFIAAFHEVDSLVPDPTTGDMVGVAELKSLIAHVAAGLGQMGTPFSRRWRLARDELLALPEPRVPLDRFDAVCRSYGLDPMATATLAHLMHDLGYIVYYGDDDRLRDDVVLQPEWLTRAIGLVLEDRTIQQMDGILPDGRLTQVWRDHPFPEAPRFDPALYPFFLRLMEKFDVSYRLEDGAASLVAQHVPQVRPALPWLPEEPPASGRRRIALVCAMDEEPPGLVPWMIVRTHDYEFAQAAADGTLHRLHWQKGMFLRNRRHGQALLELRGREFHLYTEAIWPEYFSNVLRQTLDKLIVDNWPGLKGRYAFTVPCPERKDGAACAGRFDIAALRQFLDEGDETIRCQACRKQQRIVGLLYGHEDRTLQEQLKAIQAKVDGLESRIANYVWSILRALASESRDGPRLFTIQPIDGDWRHPFSKRYCLQLVCEAEGCQHPVNEPGKGTYEFDATREWLIRVAPYAKFVVGMLKTVLPIISPAVDSFFGPDSAKNWWLKAPLDLTEKTADALLAPAARAGRPPEREHLAREVPRGQVLTDDERSGVLALHALLRDLDPLHEKLGLHRIPTYTGGYLWLCREHYDQYQSKIPDTLDLQ